MLRQQLDAAQAEPQAAVERAEVGKVHAATYTGGSLGIDCQNSSKALKQFLKTSARRQLCCAAIQAVEVSSFTQEGVAVAGHVLKEVGNYV